MNGRGGARSRSGPVPSPTSLGADKRDWTKLPASGRQGDPPEWPLSRPSARERVLWTREWARPQAIMWEQFGQELEVAFYVRALRHAESPGAKLDERRLLRSQMDALGLTIPGLLRNRWLIVEDAAQHGHRQQAARNSAKERLKLVSGGSA